MNHELQQRFDVLETERLSLNPNNGDDRFRLTVIEQQQADIRSQMDAEDRLQRQAAEVAEIDLPEDYDERWGVTGANDEIRNLLRQVKEYAFSQHNDDFAKMQEAHQARVKALEDSKAVLIDQIAVLETRLEEREAEVTQAKFQAMHAEEALEEAQSKRDNAIRLKEEAEAERDKATGETKNLKSQIDELEGMLRTYRSRSSSGASVGLVLTSSLPKETEEERKGRIERERIEQINRGLARIGSTPLPLPPSPAQVEAATAFETTEDDRFHLDKEAHNVGGLVEGDAGLEVAGEASPELTLERLAERVKALEEFKTAFEIGFFDK